MSARLGLIPAHAGKTRSGGGRPPDARAHPRSRGENRSRRERRPATTGSSPLTRGKPRGVAVFDNSEGLIPAHAGKTSYTLSRTALGRAHPRSRGENAWKAVLQGIADGSSPLTRGKHAKPQARPARQGLIPAHAGKTPSKRTAPLCGRAHPRSRGENIPLV